MPVATLTVKEQTIINGPKGLSFKYYHKDGNKIVKIKGEEQADGSFLLTIKDGNNEEKKTLSKKELLKYIKDNEQLVFAIESIEAQKGGKRKAKRVSRKGSKRSSRRTSRKGSRKGSKGGARKGSRGGSRKGSRRINKY